MVCFFVRYKLVELFCYIVMGFFFVFVIFFMVSFVYLAWGFIFGLRGFRAIFEVVKSNRVFW